MFDPYPDLVQTHTLVLPTGEGVTFEQTLWGKVIAIRVLSLNGGRYEFEDMMSTAQLRQLLEAATVGGVWGFAENDARFAELRREIMDLLSELYGLSFDA